MTIFDLGPAAAPASPLVERLESHARNADYTSSSSICFEAAECIAELESKIASAMDILSEIPGDTLEERMRAFVTMSSALEVEWRKLNDRRAKP
jgi:hypothetical protein